MNDPNRVCSVRDTTAGTSSAELASRPPPGPSRRSRVLRPDKPLASDAPEWQRQKKDKKEPKPVYASINSLTLRCTCCWVSSNLHILPEPLDRLTYRHCIIFNRGGSPTLELALNYDPFCALHVRAEWWAAGNGILITEDILNQHDIPMFWYSWNWPPAYISHILICKLKNKTENKRHSKMSRCLVSSAGLGPSV